MVASEKIKLKSKMKYGWEEVLLGKNGLIHGAKSGTVVVDMSILVADGGRDMDSAAMIKAVQKINRRG